MAVERVPGEKVFIDWVGDQLELIYDPETGEVQKAHDLFKDNTYADSCMDRLVHKAYRLEFHGKNMRNPTL